MYNVQCAMYNDCGESVMEDNIILSKSKAFALRIIELYQYLCEICFIKANFAKWYKYRC